MFLDREMDRDAVKRGEMVGSDDSASLDGFKVLNALIAIDDDMAFLDEVLEVKVGIVIGPPGLEFARPFSSQIIDVSWHKAAEWRIVFDIDIEFAFSFELGDLVDDFLSFFGELRNIDLALSHFHLDGLEAFFLRGAIHLLVVLFGFLGFLVAESLNSVDAFEDVRDCFSRVCNFDEGFYVTKENAITFLEEKMDFIGYTNREVDEFIMFWLPVLENNEKSLVYFEQTEERNEECPLLFSIEPETLIRTIIHIKKVDEATSIKEQELRHYERKGFTVTEWGGQEH